MYKCIMNYAEAKLASHGQQYKCRWKLCSLKKAKHPLCSKKAALSEISGQNERKLLLNPRWEHQQGQQKEYAFFDHFTMEKTNM